MIEAISVNIPESRLIQGAQSGDAEAFNQLMELHMDRVYAIAVKIVKDSSEAEDVTQEVFITVYNKLSGFRGDSSFSTWIYRVTVNRALRHLKKLKRSKPADDVSIFDSQVDHRPSPEDTAVEREKSQLLRDAMDRLPEKQRTVLSLRVEHALPFKEIASIMGRSVGGVKANYFHAVKKIQSAFSKGVS